MSWYLMQSPLYLGQQRFREDLVAHSVKNREGSHAGQCYAESDAASFSRLPLHTQVDRCSERFVC